MGTPTTDNTETSNTAEPAVEMGRRKALAAIARYGAVTGPAAAVLLTSASARVGLVTTAHAAACSTDGRCNTRRGNNGFGNGGVDGTPNGFPDTNR